MNLGASFDALGIRVAGQSQGRSMMLAANEAGDTHGICHKHLYVTVSFGHETTAASNQHTHRQNAGGLATLQAVTHVVP